MDGSQKNSFLKIMIPYTITFLFYFEVLITYDLSFDWYSRLKYTIYMK